MIEITATRDAKRVILERPDADSTCRTVRALNAAGFAVKAVRILAAGGAS